MKILIDCEKLSCEVFMRRGKQYLILLMSVVAFLVLNIQSANAKDELFLAGVVRTVVANSGTVVVDVKTEGCSGIRSFRADDISKLAASEGKTISFFIDSSTCKSGIIHKMHGVTQLKGGKR
jgi:hypothetical protein